MLGASGRRKEVPAWRAVGRSVSYCVRNAGIRASVGDAQCELLFVPLAVILHCCTHAFVKIFRDRGFV